MNFKNTIINYQTYIIPQLEKEKNALENEVKDYKIKYLELKSSNEFNKMKINGANDAKKK